MNAHTPSYSPTEAGFDIIPSNDMTALANKSGCFAAIKAEVRV